MSLFERVRHHEEDPIFGLQRQFQQDSRQEKVNLTLGVFISDDGRLAPIMQVVHEAEKKILEEETTKVYLPIIGDADYISETGKLIFGPYYDDRIYGTQTVGGTSALRLLFEFCKKELASEVASVSYPTWPNHLEILHALGYQVDQHPYGRTAVDFENIVHHIRNLSEYSVLLLQPMCHNPTGNDLKQEEWEEISKICYEKKLIPFFDCAYQGLGKSFEEDVWPIRHFIERGHEMLVAYSYSKSMGLYNERVGAAFVVAKELAEIDKLKNALKVMIRTTYSNPPNHGGSIAKHILLDEELKKLWQSEVDQMNNRVKSIRKEFAHLLADFTGQDHFKNIELGNGFFTLLDLSKEQTKELIQKHGIYLTKGGRVNLAGLNATNMEYVAKSLSKYLTM